MRAFAMPRWTPPAGSARRREADPVAEADGGTTAWCALLRAMEGLAAAANEGAMDDDTAQDALSYVGRAFRASLAVLLSGPQEDGMQSLANVPELTAKAMLLAAIRTDNGRLAECLLAYWLLPLVYGPLAKKCAIRCGRVHEPLRHCLCARCVPARADAFPMEASARFEDAVLVAAAAAAFPDCHGIAARTVAYMMQGVRLPAGDADAARKRDQIILNLQQARVEASTWPAGAAGDRRREAALAAVNRAPNRRTALAGLRLSPPVGDDCDEADVIAAAGAAKAAADAEGGGCPMSDYEDDDVKDILVPLLLDRALCAVSGDGGADGRWPADAAAAAAAAEAAAAALLAEEEGAKGAPAASGAGKKKRAGSSARKRAAAAAAAAQSAPAQSLPPPDEARAASDDAAADAAPGQNERAASTADAALEELFPWLALDAAAPARVPPPAVRGSADVAHEDDGLCIVCLDADRDTPLPGCAGKHAPVLCAACAVAVCARAASAACPWCDAPCASGRT